MSRKIKNEQNEKVINYINNVFKSRKCESSNKRRKYYQA